MDPIKEAALVGALKAQATMSAILLKLLVDSGTISQMDALVVVQAGIDSQTFHDLSPIEIMKKTRAELTPR